MNKPIDHIAIIMDGNRRWARAHSLPEVAGHEFVVNHVIEELVDECVAQHIPYLTLWAFSTENWNRSTLEVNAVLNLFRKAFEKNVQDLHKKGVRLLMIGDLSRFPEDIQKNVARWIEMSKDNTKITLIIALNYGGRDEIVRAMKKLSVENFPPEKLREISTDSFGEFLDTAGVPDPDLIIRPGGEKRLSGFMLWQSAYAELYFSDLMMPEFRTEALRDAVQDYGERKRRFGK
ncbi:MAG: Isoprenyl transferase [Microgenomates group bacterium GW2011_GWF2_45_18]|nr:MAG: Isoprenyl transferase [Microgenomates group bacterium GW2011_GWF1_44_10]KKU01904.1 MAG: Isoprenyl transferase [Microgenomates group bacterium GW2011_GWF2_45_18]OGJ40246.1 MAG: di-trans,poly-cis-decaprenylcistransferase [Candidatus Pacebacteria bacterium RIFOXYB1_FULL_44_10]HAU98779.1 di-trans,poly-cis-decaprenylcistransferase [Candidatus Paceibacterota bacterium]HAX01401.1 di-trans,poly-cis-decaprenylcistransferase [Candidatus Paceibacterota bacterium]